MPDRCHWEISCSDVSIFTLRPTFMSARAAKIFGLPVAEAMAWLAGDYIRLCRRRRLYCDGVDGLFFANHATRNR